MVKSLNSIRQQMQKLVEEVVIDSKNSNEEDVKNNLFDAFNLNDTVFLGGLPEEEVAKAGKVLLPNKPNGPFTFLFECIVWKGDTDYYKKYKIEKYTADADNFVDACKEAFAWRERYLYDIYNVAGFMDVK